VHSAAKMVREEELMRLLMCGHMLKECAIHLHMSYRTVREYARQPEFMRKLKEMSAAIYERVDAELKDSKDGITARLEAYSEQALEEMMELARTCTNPVVKLKANQDIMDRDTRLSRTRKIEASQSHSFVDPLFLVHAAGVAKELDAKKLEQADDDKPKSD
jgi:hypothetical protein